MVFKRGQSAANTASLIALVAGLMIIYILFLPPDVRDDLLDDGPSTRVPRGDVYVPDEFREDLRNTSIYSTTPGRIDNLLTGEYEHFIPSIHLFTKKDPVILKREDSMYVKNGIFDKKFRNVTFAIDELEDTQNILLSFAVKSAKGTLTVLFNDEVIYEGSPSGTINPIDLSRRDIGSENTVTFMVDSVGFRFWTTNEYEITDVKITADVTDRSREASRTTFTVTDAEKINLAFATIRFYPDCNPRDVGLLQVFINNNNIYSSIPSCGEPNYVEVPPSTISSGSNTVTFRSDYGSYLVDQIMIRTELDRLEFPVFYFDLPFEIFRFSDELVRDRFLRTEECGEVDGYCPLHCDDDEDIDCCFRGRSNKWCDIEPDNLDDRCRAVTDISQCGLCPSGYEDEDGRPAEECEDLCGDDTDNKCPSGCSKFYDEDCCFEEDDENFWCDDLPDFGGEQSICENSLTVNECDDCPTGYRTEKGRRSDYCPIESLDDFIEIAYLRDEFRVILYMEFVDDGSRHNSDVYINGHRFNFDTFNDYYSRDISDYVEEGSNALKLEPSSYIDVRKLWVEIEEI